MGHYEISALPWSFRQRISRWNFREFWQVSGSAVIDESFPNQFKWAPFTNGVAAERGTSRPRHRWHRLLVGFLSATQNSSNQIWRTLLNTITGPRPIDFTNRHKTRLYSKPLHKSHWSGYFNPMVNTWSMAAESTLRLSTSPEKTQFHRCHT